jgi:hypothetical protein
MVTRALAIAALLATGCDYLTSGFITNDFSGDAKPVYVDTSSGAVRLGVDDGTGPRAAVLDVLSPVTLVDPGAGVSPSILEEDLLLLGARPPGGGAFDVPRARLVQHQVLQLHPCSDDTCAVGPDASPTAFSAIVGMDAFASDALRFDLAPAAGGSDQLFILPDVAGDETTRSKACDAVLPRPFRGGGTMIIGGTELTFTNWRIALDTCLAPDPEETTALNAQGADTLLVLSTGIGISLLDETAYTRYAQANAMKAKSLAAVEQGPMVTVDIASGPVSGWYAWLPPRTATQTGVTLPVLAIAADSTTDPRGPCRQVYANHLLTKRTCNPDNDPSGKCPCQSGKTCTAPAVLELSPYDAQTTDPTGPCYTPPGIAPATGCMKVLVVSDDNPTLQALRTELRPDQPEVDGILGADALRTLELDVDYAHDRLLGRCASPSALPNPLSDSLPTGATCIARPELSDPKYRQSLQNCLVHPVMPIR